LDEVSLSNTPVNVLVGFETLKVSYSLNSEESYDYFYFDVQLRYALGCRNLHCV
jgi:hypothetical protein